MPSLPTLFSIVESLPADAQKRIADALAAAVEEESLRLEQQAKSLRSAVRGVKTGLPAKAGGRKARAAAKVGRGRAGKKKQRLTEADYESIRSNVAAKLEKKREYPQPELFALTRSLGFDVKKATFTKKVLDPLCETGVLVWNEQRRGSAYTAS